MAKKKKLGRTPLPDDLKKRHAVMVKFDDSEMAKVREMARRQPLASFLREKALA